MLWLTGIVEFLVFFVDRTRPSKQLSTAFVARILKVQVRVIWLDVEGLMRELPSQIRCHSLLVTLWQLLALLPLLVPMPLLLLEHRFLLGLVPMVQRRLARVIPPITTKRPKWCLHLHLKKGKQKHKAHVLKMRKKFHRNKQTFSDRNKNCSTWIYSIQNYQNKRTILTSNFTYTFYISFKNKSVHVEQFLFRSAYWWLLHITYTLHHNKSHQFSKKKKKNWSSCRDVSYQLHVDQFASVFFCESVVRKQSQAVSTNLEQSPTYHIVVDFQVSRRPSFEEF